ncbi:MAG: hypothetical protein V4643_11765 [Bacteroidota bacterium]
MNKIIKIQPFNPYEALFPNRKVINLDTLILIKILREEGYEVQILPLDERPVQYVFRKGLTEILSDPINIMLFNIPITIVTNIISNYIQKNLDKSSDKKTNPDKNIIIIEGNNNNVFYNYEGDMIKENDIAIRTNRILDTQNKFEKAFKTKAPEKFPPVPIFYEHQPEIVGWCRIKMDAKGLLVSEGQILDKKIKNKIAKGTIKGLSVTGIATKTECSTCKSDFITCLHFGDGVTNTIVKADFIEVSLVKTPLNEKCLVSLI